MFQREWMGTRLQSLSPAASKYNRTSEFIFGSRCFFFLLFEDHLICQLTLSVNTLKTLFLLRRRVREILVFLLQKVSLKCRLINRMNGKCRNIVLKAFCYWTNIAGGNSLNLSQEQTANTVNEIFQSFNVQLHIIEVSKEQMRHYLWPFFRFSTKVWFEVRLKASLPKVKDY